MKLRNSTTLAATLILGLTIGVSLAHAQESCDADSISAAIEGVASDGACVADGQYVASDGIVDAVIDKCGDKAKKACKACFKTSTTSLLRDIRDLVKYDLLPQEIVSSTKAALAAAMKENCDGEGGSGGGDGEVGPTPEPTPPSTEPTPPPAETPGSQPSLAQQTLASIHNDCCSKAEGEFAGCKNNKISYAQGKGLSQADALEIYKLSRSQVCTQK